MNRHPRRPHPWAAILLASLLLNGGLAPSAAAQKKERKPVVVSFGQPNIWSLEQAHYLLARMHTENLGLKAKGLTQEQLDPNAVHATRINILKSLLEINAQYDQGVGFNNEQLVRTREYNLNRRQELTTKRDQRRDDSLRLTREITQLKFERAQMEKDKASAEDLKLKDAQIEQKTAERDAVNQEVTFYNDELKTLGAEPSGTPQAPSTSGTPFDKSRLPTSVLDEIVKDDVKKLLEAARDPKLNASTVLDNHVQMQYEIIAKQLTLLRDEVGPGERLVFLELPQSVYTTPGAGDEKMAQTWWHVNGYTRTDPLLRLLLELYEVEWKWKKIREVGAFKKLAGQVSDLKCEPGHRNKLTDEYEKMFFDLKCEHDDARERVLRNLVKTASSDFDRVEQGGSRDTSQIVEAIRRVVEIKRAAAPDAAAARRAAGRTGSFVAARVGAATEDSARRLTYELLDVLSNPVPDVRDASGDARRPLYSFDSGIEFVGMDEGRAGGGRDAGDIERRTVRTVDIIPRQSSLNVNDIQETVKATGILAAFKFLFGFAGQVNYMRQREQYEQFLHQELYASGFGKGNRDFGWTFGALPGTKRVAPGVRTTYAALVVPDDADSVVLSARGCYFPRKGYQPLDYEDGADRDWNDDDKFKRYNCGEEQTYILPVPGGGGSNNFWVTSVEYQPVKKEGQRAVVSIRGNNFSSQIGVLVDGMALKHSVGLAQPLMAGTADTDRCATVTTVCGDLERIDARQIVISFKHPTKGTPVITLMGPGKSIDLNSLYLTVNGERNKRLKDFDASSAVFAEPPKPPDPPKPPAKLSIKDFNVFRVSPDSRMAFAVLTGTKFDANTQVFINGKPLNEGPEEVVVTVQGRGRRRKVITTHRKRSEYKEHKSGNLYRLIFQLPPDENVTVTVMQGDVVESKSVASPAR